MYKTYRQTGLAKLFLFGILALEVALVFNSFKNRETGWFLFSILGVVILGYAFLAAGIYLRITINEEGIGVDSKKLMRSKGLRWEEVEAIVDDSWLGIHLYHCIPKNQDKKRITIPSSIENYKDLLAEAVKRLPGSRIDSSIIQLINKSGNN